MNTSKNKILIIAAILAYICMIFVFSNQTGPRSNNVSKSIINCIGKYISIPEDMAKELDENKILRKVTHFFEYYILAIFFTVAFRYFYTKRVYSYALLLCLLFAVFDEIHQAFVPGRTPGLIDVLIDTLGGLTGIICVMLCFMLIKHMKDSRTH